MSIYHKLEPASVVEKQNRFLIVLTSCLVTRLESATRSLEISAPLGVAIESRAGDISAACLTDLKLQSTGGSVRVPLRARLTGSVHNEMIDSVVPAIFISTRSAFDHVMRT